MSGLLKSSYNLQVGFDALYFSRIDYQDREKRKDLKSLEVVWRGSKTLGSSADVFTGIFPKNYEPPPGDFYFEVDDESLFFPLFFWRSMDGRVNALYSTPSIYTDAKYAANESWPLKTDDFFPYADNPNAYWTGYFTSRPALKGYVRTMSAYYLAARQLEFLKGRNSSGPTTDSLADALAIAQHHDAVSGTEKQHVANDYAKRLSIGYAEAEKLVESSLACLTSSDSKSGCYKPVMKFKQCPLLNISYCPPAELDLSTGKSLVVLVYNSLGWKREDVIRIPVISESVVVHDYEGREIESQLLPLTNASVYIRNHYVKAYLGISPSVESKFWLAFPVSVPPLGFNTYFVSNSKRTGASMSSLYSSQGSKSSSIEIGQGHLKLLYNADGQKLSHYFNTRNLVKANVEQSYSFYAGYDKNGTDLQASGAYIFRPNGSFPIKPEGQVPLMILQGPILDEVHQQINPWIYQIRDYRSDWELEVNQPVAGNYYPINLGIYLEDNSTELSVLVDRSVGGTSILDGQIELMLHRRLLHDDGRGVAEALNETVCINDKCEGLTVQGKFYLRIDPLGEGAKWRRSFGQEIYSPLLLAFSEQDGGNWTSSHIPKFSAMDSYSLPDNVALITLQVFVSSPHLSNTMVNSIN
ncbi:alpha-mannosidase [Cocos nucifera]|uniref:Alpha-mannosidase n=1 Tax=Cocos nucifera TaxID=13894 RepID=A0A8K0IZ19_COCNU|nr:alpha-mannosidase [Cocos nucifera]